MEDLARTQPLAAPEAALGRHRINPTHPRTPRFVNPNGHKMTSPQLLIVTMMATAARTATAARMLLSPTVFYTSRISTPAEHKTDRSAPLK